LRYRFETIGQPGHWRIVSGAGASNPSKMSGTMGDYVDIDIHKVIGRWTPLKFE
jgi:hypothetical protein